MPLGYVHDGGPVTALVALFLYKPLAIQFYSLAVLGVLSYGLFLDVEHHDREKKHFQKEFREHGEWLADRLYELGISEIETDAALAEYRQMTEHFHVETPEVCARRIFREYQREAIWPRRPM